MSRTDKIQRLLEHAERYAQLPRLLEIIHVANPTQYAYFEPRLLKAKIIQSKIENRKPVLNEAEGSKIENPCATGGLTSPFYNIFEQRWLGLLSPVEWQALVMDHLAVTEEDLTFLEKVAGGQPFFTQMAASYLWSQKSKGAVDYEVLYQELWAQMEPYLKHLWSKLQPVEQGILRRQAGSGTSIPDPHHLAALERRGLVRQDRPFSYLFKEMITGGYIEH
ncbi:MAG: hypothetical protein HYR94_01135 [Chloroflexi bacterium]|nr:hypothetical protein [Chloroflexota bacterium]